MVLPFEHIDAPVALSNLAYAPAIAHVPERQAVMV